MSCIPAVHHALGYIDSASRDIAVEIDIGDTIDGPRVHSHAQTDSWDRAC